MDILGLTNEFAKKGYSKKIIQFRTIRGHQMAYDFKRRDYKIDTRTQDLHFSVPPVDEIVIPRFEIGENGKVKQLEGTTKTLIAYVRGASSIFVDEIMEQFGFNSRDEVFEQAEEIRFFNESLNLAPHEVAKIAYLRATNLNRDVSDEFRSGSPTFYEFDTSEISAKRVKNRLRNAKVEAYALEMIEKNQLTTQWGIFSCAKNLTISKAKEMFSLFEVQDFILSWAKDDPTGFDDMANSSDTLDRMYVMQALEEKYFKVSPDGRIHDETDEHVATVGAGGSPTDAIINQMDEESFRRLRKKMEGVFLEMADKHIDETEEMQRLRAENERLKHYKEIADTVKPETLDKVTGEVSVEEATRILKGLAAEERLTIHANRWIKENSESLLPPNEENNDKTWCFDTLPLYYSKNPGAFRELKRKL